MVPDFKIGVFSCTSFAPGEGDVDCSRAHWPPLMARSGSRVVVVSWSSVIQRRRLVGKDRGPLGVQIRLASSTWPSIVMVALRVPVSLSTGEYGHCPEVGTQLRATGEEAASHLTKLYLVGRISSSVQFDTRGGLAGLSLGGQWRGAQIAIWIEPS